MLALSIVAVFILIIAVIVYIEYRNEKAYQEERKRHADERRKSKPLYDHNVKIQKPHIEKKKKAVEKKAAIPDTKEKSTLKKEPAKDVYELKEHASPQQKKPVQKTQEPYVNKTKIQKPKPAAKTKVVEKKPTPEVTKESAKDLPECSYPPFTYSRLLEMGLSEEEALEFTKELIPQINTQIPLIEEALKKEDYHNMERLTHSIKGSSTTVGTGGISDLLVECNTYLKKGTDKEIAAAYLKHLKHYAQELEKQFA